MKREKGSKSKLRRRLLRVIIALELLFMLFGGGCDGDDTGKTNLASCGNIRNETGTTTNAKTNTKTEKETDDALKEYMEGIKDQVYLYNGKTHKFEIELPDKYRINKTLYGNTEDLPIDAGKYNVTLEIKNAKTNDITKFFRFLTISPADSALKAENQSIDWTGEKVTPEYTAADGATVKLECKSDLTSPGIHTVRLYVEQGNYNKAECTINVTINPQVTFIMGEQEIITHAPYGGTVTPPELSYVPAGCRFIGWDAEIPDEITENLELTAVYRKLTKASYNIGFVINADAGAIVVPTARGQLPVAPDAETIEEYTPDGMRFAGWSPAIVPANADVTYYAVFEPITYVITFDMNGYTETVTVAHGETPVAPSADLAQNYAPIDTEFTGWSPVIVPATANVTYYAQYA